MNERNQLFVNFWCLLKKLFKEFKPDVLTLDDECSIGRRGIVAKVKHCMGEKINPFNYALTSPEEMYVCIGYKNIIKVTKKTLLPFEESVIVDVNPSKSITLSIVD